MLLKLRRVLKDRKGQGLVEYGILIGGVVLICLVAVSVLGHKTNDMIAAVATVIPGAHADDNGALVSGHLVETETTTTPGTVLLDVSTITTNAGQPRLGNNLGINLSTLVVEP